MTISQIPELRAGVSAMTMSHIPELRVGSVCNNHITHTWTQGRQCLQWPCHTYLNSGQVVSAMTVSHIPELMEILSVMTVSHIPELRAGGVCNDHITHTWTQGRQCLQWPCHTYLNSGQVLSAMTVSHIPELMEILSVMTVSHIPELRAGSVCNDRVTHTWTQSR